MHGMSITIVDIREKFNEYEEAVGRSQDMDIGEESDVPEFSFDEISEDHDYTSCRKTSAQSPLQIDDNDKEDNDTEEDNDDEDEDDIEMDNDNSETDSDMGINYLESRHLYLMIRRLRRGPPTYAPLKTWLWCNRHNPYASNFSLVGLQGDTGLTEREILAWFAECRLKVRRVMMMADYNYTNWAIGNGVYVAGDLCLQWWQQFQVYLMYVDRVALVAEDLIIWDETDDAEITSVDIDESECPGAVDILKRLLLSRVT